MTPKVDLVILSRDGQPLHPDVERSLRSQHGVRLVVHRVIGSPGHDDRRRWDAIARARNEGKSRGASRWLMFLDDDVVLDPKCVLTLVSELRRRPLFAALAADYLGERRSGRVAPHVSMGATLFRREALDQIRFASDRNKCECQVCCDDLRQLHWGIDYSAAALARHLPKSKVSRPTAANDTPPENSMISCLCVTRGRVRLLRRAVACFLNQSYQPRELVIVFDSDDDATARFVAELRDSSIRLVEAPAAPRLTLGALRNMAVKAAAGKFVAQWDDDDWSSPARLAEQMKAVQDSGKRGCVLERWTLYDGAAKRAYVSNRRPWEGSFLGDRAILPPYPDVPKKEDTPVVSELIRRGQLVLLDRPELYVYTHHGKNTWDRRHWQQIIDAAQPLPDETSQALAALLDASSPRPERSQTIIENAICKSLADRSRRSRTALRLR